MLRVAEYAARNGHHHTLPQSSLSSLQSAKEASQTLSFTSTKTRQASICFSFCLRNDPKALDCQENFDRIFALYPGTVSLTYDQHFLIFHISELPARPWPRRIAGVPPYFTRDAQDFGPVDALTKIQGNPEKTCAIGLDVRHNLELFEKNLKVLTKWLDFEEIAATEIQYWEDMIVIVLKDNDQDLDNCPSSFASLHCRYLYERDMKMLTIKCLSNKENGRACQCERSFIVRTWFGSSSSIAECIWVQARWVWVGEEGPDAVSQGPMKGWGICASKIVLDSLLENRNC